MEKIDIQNMNKEDVVIWFHSINMSKVAEVVGNESIDGETLVEFELDDFTEIGVSLKTSIILFPPNIKN